MSENSAGEIELAPSDGAIRMRVPRERANSHTNSRANEEEDHRIPCVCALYWRIPPSEYAALVLCAFASACLAQLTRTHTQTRSYRQTDRLTFAPSSHVQNRINLNEARRENADERRRRRHTHTRVVAERANRTTNDHIRT